jgi:hypothetical protein
MPFPTAHTNGLSGLFGSSAESKRSTLDAIVALAAVATMSGSNPINSLINKNSLGFVRFSADQPSEQRSADAAPQAHEAGGSAHQGCCRPA